MSLANRITGLFNVINAAKDPKYIQRDTGPGGYAGNPDTPIISNAIEKTIVNSIINRIAVDIANKDIKHVMLDEEGRYSFTIDSPLNNCLTLSANIDQTSRDFMVSLVTSLLADGKVAIVPTVTDTDPLKIKRRNGDIVETDCAQIYSYRVGEITQWFPSSIRVRVYNEHTCDKEDIILPKSTCAIIMNPFYEIMNRPNSTMQRLNHKLNLLDQLDERNNNGKMNMIIQLPYLVKTEQREKQAEARRASIERQLVDSKYGIAYIDGTEKIMQLNRPIESNLLEQVKYWTDQLMVQLGITPEILNGTANETTMLNYTNRVLEPILNAITQSMKCKFLTQTARSQGHSIMYFNDPFKLIPVGQLADIADKFTRNEILTSNEIRQIVGRTPSSDPNADVLRNKNLNQTPEQMQIEQQTMGEEGASNDFNPASQQDSSQFMPTEQPAATPTPENEAPETMDEAVEIGKAILDVDDNQY